MVTCVGNERNKLNSNPEQNLFAMLLALIHMRKTRNCFIFPKLAMTVNRKYISKKKKKKRKPIESLK